MADYFVAISEDGLRFTLKSDGTWEPEITPKNIERICFRSSDWGDSPEKVKAAEKSDPIEETENALAYKAHVGGFPADLIFQFVDGLLNAGTYAFTQEHSNEYQYVVDFEILKKLMISKYGEPTEISDYWNNDLYRDDPFELGKAVERGHYAVFITWKSKETAITLAMSGDNYVIHLNAFYVSERLKSLADAARDQEKLVGL